MCMADMQPNCDNDQPNIMVLKIYLISIVLHTFNIDDLTIAEFFNMLFYINKISISLTFDETLIVTKTRHHFEFLYHTVTKFRGV